MRYVLSLALCFTLAAASRVPAQEELASEYEVVVEGLSNPTGVAVQPGTGDVFVADSAAGRVIRLVDGEVEEVITGFPLDTYGSGPEYQIGPLGLAFFDEETLVVSGGELADTEEVIRIYEVPAAGEPALAADAAATVLGPLESTGDLAAEGNYYAVAMSPSALYATANGDDTQGWIVRSEITGTRFGELERWLATKEAVEVDAPVAIALSPRGELVVGQMGEIGTAGDSLLSFYSDSGALLLNLTTGLNDICGLVYSPEKQLYAVDFSWVDPAQGGLFRLERSGQRAADSCHAERMLTLDKPTALAFGDDGSLYITLFGTAAEGSENPAGQLIRIPPGL